MSSRWYVLSVVLLTCQCLAMSACRRGGFHTQGGGLPESRLLDGGTSEEDAGHGLGDGSVVPGPRDGGPFDGGVMTAHGATWVLIDVSGTPFTMGSPEGERGRMTTEVAHAVTLTRNYWLMETEITQKQYEDVMAYNPSRFSACGPNCPVEWVNWHEVAAYANELSVSDGLGECYECTGTAPDAIVCLPSGSYPTPYDCPGYRLPTEAEWEYAARGGTTTATYAGDLATTDCTDTTLDPIAWFCGNASGTTHPVRTKTGNAYGLYDMLGNVREWCHDWYGAYPGGAETDPTGPSSGSDRVLRGGSWYNDAENARAADRNRRAADPGDRWNNIGSRILRSVP